MAAAALSAGCATYGPAPLTQAERFELLYERRLTAFEQRLANERQLGVQDAWTSVGYAWIALSSCEPVPRPEDGALDGDALAKLVYTTLQLEDARSELMARWRGARLRKFSVKGSIHAFLVTPQFFEREPEAYSDQLIAWPNVAGEGWVDEAPAQVEIPSSCKARYDAWFRQSFEERREYAKVEAVFAAYKRDPIKVVEPPPPRLRMHLHPDPEVVAQKAPARDTIAASEQRVLALTESVLEQIALLPEDVQQTESVQRLKWTTIYYVSHFIGFIVNDLLRSKRLTATERELANAWFFRSKVPVEEMGDAILAGGATEVSAEYRVALLFSYAQHREGARAWSDVIAAHEAAQDLGIERIEDDTYSRYTSLRALVAVERYADAAEAAKTLPSPGSPYYAASVYYAGVAMRALGRTDEFMGLALGAFRDRPFKKDPFLRAVYVQTLRVMVGYPFEERTLELLEDMGERSLIYERVEEYAKVALDEGEAENAKAAARWLIASHEDAQARPRYHGVLALASFLEDDADMFVEHIQDIVRRPKKVVAAIPEWRRPVFFQAADQELAAVLRQMLPVMAEWGDTEKAVALRQTWLELIITEAQEFVRNTPESVARPQLIELYRLSSALLEEDAARAYPERVGSEQPVPLVLGTVRVSERDLSPFEPSGAPSTPEVFSLTMVPRDAESLDAWPEFWDVPRVNEEKKGEERGR